MTQLPGIRELIGRVRRDGFNDARRRVVRRLYDRVDAGSLEFPLLAQDIADSTTFSLPPAARREATDSPLTVGWVCTPPAPGSGGHTTLFRMVAALEREGKRCILYLYDRHGGDLARHSATIRRYWPQMQAEVRDAMDGIAGADAYVASSWETAHVLASRASGPGARLYFIQDFEPYFYARGTKYALAEDSYRFGFRNIALGEFVANELRDIGVSSVTAPFGCDTDVYRLTNEDGPRSGVVYYTKPGSDRRGYLLGKLALEEFHRRHPDQPVHLYGDATDGWDIPTVQHRRLSPVELNVLYNQTLAGLAISFTNITLVAEELLAAGNTPVVTEVRYARDVLPNSHVLWSAATPGALADSLSRAVESRSLDSRRREMSQSVRNGWAPTGRAVSAAIAEAVGVRQ